MFIGYGGEDVEGVGSEKGGIGSGGWGEVEGESLYMGGGLDTLTCYRR